MSKKVDFMRKLLDLILIVVLFLFLFWQKDKITSDFNYLLSSPCDQPLTYHLGEVDQGYGLSRDQFLTKVEEAGRIWDAVVGKNLFVYNPQGKMVVNLIYTDRQSMADNLNSLENNLKSGKQSLDSSIAEYKNLQADFENKLQAFNEEVNNWNKQSFSSNPRGGTLEDVFNRLKTQQDELKAEADRLNNLAAQLNPSVERYNLGVGEFNQNAQNLNEAIKVKPEAGLYNGSILKIDIYLTSSDKELVHTLTHEMGHALGLAHVDNPQAIMYPFTNEVVQPAVSEKTALQVYCHQRNLEMAVRQLEKSLREKLNQFKLSLR